MIYWNLMGAWIGIVAGMLSGAAVGLFFHRREWLGGYDSWARRSVRLGHISFFGLAFINLGFVLTVAELGPSLKEPLEGLLSASSVLLLCGAVLMPTLCFLSAWRQPLRHLFCLPVGSLLAGAVCLILSEVLP